MLKVGKLKNVTSEKNGLKSRFCELFTEKTQEMLENAIRTAF